MQYYKVYGSNVPSAETLEASPLGLGTVLRLESDAWSNDHMTNESKTNEYALPSPPPPGIFTIWPSFEEKGW